MKRTSLALAFIALVSIEFGCMMSEAIASAAQIEENPKTTLSQLQTGSKDYTPPITGMPRCTEGGGTR